MTGCLSAVLALAVLPAHGATGVPHAVADGAWRVGAAGTGRVDLCRTPAGSRPTASAVPWIHGRTWVRTSRPVVDGAGRRTDAALSLTVRGGVRTIAGNGLPLGTALGTFPVAGNDDAHPWAAGAAAPVAQVLRGTIPNAPVSRAKPGCMGLSAPVGVAVNGVPILPALSADGTDAVAREVVDRCSGRTDAAGRYYYRATLRCLDKPVKGTSPVVGWARDGYPIVGAREGGRLIKNADLDACHGHTSTVVVGGRRVRTYHYNLTADPPYTLGCFRARSAKDWTLKPAQEPVDTGPKTLAITTTPALVPGFSPAVHDYVSRCAAGGLPVAVAAPAGVTVSVDGGAARTGRFSATVPIASGQGTTIAIRGGSGAGTYRVRCLPEDFPAYTSQRTGTPQAAYEIVTPSLGPDGRNYVAVFDRDGVPVWWTKTDAAPIDAKVLPDGNLIWGLPVPEGPVTFPHAFEEHRLDGTLVHTWRAVGMDTDLHDIQPLPNGNMLMIAYSYRDHVDLTSVSGPSDGLAGYVEIQEIAPSGSLVWSWSSVGHIGTAEAARWSTLSVTLEGTPYYDVVHMNAVEPDGDLILTSARHTDALYAIDRSTGDIVWKLGGTHTPQSLTILGDPLAATDFGGQHDVRVLPDGTITVHDNGTGRGRPPRAMRFRIDRTAGTATLLESVEDPTPLASPCCGSARRLAGGNWVMSWGGLPIVTELTPAGKPVLKITFDGVDFSYRATPVADGVLSASALRAGMDAMHPRPAAAR